MVGIGRVCQILNISPRLTMESTKEPLYLLWEGVPTNQMLMNIGTHMFLTGVVLGVTHWNLSGATREDAQLQNRLRSIGLYACT
jgi:hypothetical protein